VHSMAMIVARGFGVIDGDDAIDARDRLHPECRFSNGMPVRAEFSDRTGEDSDRSPDK